MGKIYFSKSASQALGELSCADTHQIEPTDRMRAMIAHAIVLSYSSPDGEVHRQIAYSLATHLDFDHMRHDLAGFFRFNDKRPDQRETILYIFKRQAAKHFTHGETE